MFMKGKAGILTGNLGYYALAHLSLFLFGFLKIPVLTNLFSPQELGVYAWCVALLAYFDIIFLSWANATLWRYIYQNEAGSSFIRLLSAILPLLLFILGGAAILLTIIIVAFVPESEKVWMLVIGFCTIVSQQAISIYYLYLQSQKKIRPWCWSIVAQLIIGFALLLLFTLRFNAGVYSIFLSALVFNILFCLLKFIQHKAVFKYLFGRFSLRDYKAITTYSYLAILLSCCLMLLNNGDRFLISYLKSDSTLGLYAQSYSLASVGLYAAIQAFNTIIAPSYNRALLHKEDSNTTKNIIAVYVLLFTPLLVFLVLNAKAITTLLLSPSFQGYHAVFAWAATGIYCYGICHFLEVRLKFINKTGTVLAILAIAAFLNILLNRILLPENNVTVAAIISFASYLLLLLAFTWYNWQFIIQLHLKKLIRDLFFSSGLFITFHFLLAQQQLFQSPILNITIDCISAVLIYYSFLKKHISLLTYFFQKIV
jgi:O-antigen/teichoic acid export membrane protein